MATDDKFKSSATFSHTVSHFSTHTEVILSEVHYVRGLPWRIRFDPNYFDGKHYSQLRLVCDAGEDFLRRLSCNVVGVIRIVSQKQGVLNFDVEIDERFTGTKYMSSTFSFGPSSDDIIYDPDKGYVIYDVVIFEVSFTADLPVESEVTHGQFQEAVKNNKNKDEWCHGCSHVHFPFRARFPFVFDAAGGDKLSDVTLICQITNLPTLEVLTPIVCSFMFGVHITLRFIYCGYVETDLSQVTPEVHHDFLYAAEKYDLKCLTHLVILAIEETLTPANVCTYLMYAEKFSLATVKILID